TWEKSLVATASARNQTLRPAMLAGSAGATTGSSTRSWLWAPAASARTGRLTIATTRATRVGTWQNPERRSNFIGPSSWFDVRGYRGTYRSKADRAGSGHGGASG